MRMVGGALRWFCGLGLLLQLVVGATGEDAVRRPSEYAELPGHTKKEWKSHAHLHEYLDGKELPASFNWGDVDGVSYLTHSMNQHIPQYCGSCWNFGSLSSLADRIKILRKAEGVDINLATQFVLNCGTKIAGSCHGGSHTGAFQFIKETGYVPFDSCLAYEACSAESKEGLCEYGDYTCKPINVCRTCNTFKAFGGFCSEIDEFPNASIAEYGTLPDAEAVKREIYARGPVACGVNANELLKYNGGIIDLPHASQEIDHIIETVGWGTDESNGRQYWIARNSWGSYWGEGESFFRIYFGQLGMDTSCAWATIKSFTEPGMNKKCWEDGGNCVRAHQEVVDTHTLQIPMAELVNVQ